MPEVEASLTIESFLSTLESAFSSRDIDAVVELFGEECYWRDLVSFTWNITTLEGREQVRDMVASCLERVQPSNWRLQAGETPVAHGDVFEGWITFDTALARGLGFVRLKQGKVWTLLTTMVELKGHEERAGFTRPLGARHGVHPGAKTWKEQRDAESAELGFDVQPDTVIVGGGQAGIALGARLRQLGVPTIILERNERPGDSWRKRYKTLCLHDPVWYDHLPYIDFPKNWPVFSPKDKIADWLEMYAKVMELNYWGSSAAKAATYDETEHEWELLVERDGKELTLRPKQLVFATGLSGKPNVPQFAGMESFAGEQHHSSEHPGPDRYAGKRVVVIGSNNSAHDICAALFEVGADVTMVQRSATTVVRSDTFTALGLGPLYSEQAVQNGVTADRADLIGASTPYRLLDRIHKEITEKVRAADADFYRDLEGAGFRLDFGPDDTGLAMKYLRRGSGYYIDVGASQLIIDGQIKLVSGQVIEITPTEVVVEGGTRLPADVIVYATGYASMNGWVADLVSQDVADSVGKVWGFGSSTPKDPGPWEGEQRNMWKPTSQEALWFHGGNLAQSRFYSKYVALQLKARYEGIPTPVYGLQPSFHRG